MEGEFIGEKEAILSATSIFRKHIETLGELKTFINQNLSEFSDNTPVFFEKIDVLNRKIVIEPLLIELADAKEPYISFDNGNTNKFENN